MPLPSFVLRVFVAITRSITRLKDPPRVVLSLEKMIPPYHPEPPFPGMANAIRLGRANRLRFARARMYATLPCCITSLVSFNVRVEEFDGMAVF